MAQAALVYFKLFDGGQHTVNPCWDHDFHGVALIILVSWNQNPIHQFDKWQHQVMQADRRLHVGRNVVSVDYSIARVSSLKPNGEHL
tara:strand:- start:2523 stop:2783 length:261 start_codon:yes stop_codon:yes gene_type:complete